VLARPATGSGKTTLGRLWCAVLKRLGGIKLRRCQIGQLDEAERRPLRTRIQMIFRYAVFVNPRRLGTTLTRPARRVHGRLRGNGISGERGRRSLDLVGLPPRFAERYPTVPAASASAQASRVRGARTDFASPTRFVWPGRRPQELTSCCPEGAAREVASPLVSQPTISRCARALRTTCRSCTLARSGRIWSSRKECGVAARLTQHFVAAIRAPIIEAGW